MLRAITVSFVTLALIPWIASADTVSSVNNGLSVDDETVTDNSYSTVNGGLHVGDDCEIAGHCSTVNGGISIGDRSTIDRVSTINGGITIGKNTRILGKASTVNGYIRCQSKCVIGDTVSTVHGSIKLEDSTAGENLETVSGDVTLTGASEVIGDIVIKRAKNRNRWNDKEIDIRIEDTSVVRGDILVEDDHAEVTVYIDESARIDGMISNAKVVRVE